MTPKELPQAISDYANSEVKEGRASNNEFISPRFQMEETIQTYSSANKKGPNMLNINHKSRIKIIDPNSSSSFGLPNNSSQEMDT